MRPATGAPVVGRRIRLRAGVYCRARSSVSFGGDSFGTDGRFGRWPLQLSKDWRLLMKRALVAASAIAILTGAQSFAQTVGVGPAETVIIEPEQRTVIRDYVVKERVAPVTVKERPSVGATLPADVELQIPGRTVRPSGDPDHRIVASADRRKFEAAPRGRLQLCLASKLLRLGVDRHRSQRSNPGRACFNRSLRAAVAAFIFALRLRSVVRKLGVDAGHPHLVSARRALWRITLFGFIRWDILVFVKKG